MGTCQIAPIQFFYDVKMIMDDVVLGEMIGVGAYGAVFKAKIGERDFAVKQLHSILAVKGPILESFKNEAKRLATLQYSYIVQFYGFDEEKSQIILELCDSSLQKIIRPRSSSRTTTFLNHQLCCFGAFSYSLTWIYP